MYLLDTNVISELTKPLPSEAVLNWFAATPNEQIYISAVTVCEIELGLSLMPDGRRRDALRTATENLIEQDFHQRCLGLDLLCAPAYGQLAAAKQKLGRSSSTEDAMIAAIAIANHLTLVTRNTKDFEGIDGLALVNPWQALAA
jgi:toxin FitB